MGQIQRVRTSRVGTAIPIRLAVLAILGFAALLIVFMIAIQKSIDFGTAIRSRCKDCNVIILSIDTFAATHLSCYGYGRETAPFLCSLAEKGVLFRNAYSHSSFTLDSHLSIFTSLYPSVHGVVNMFTDELDPSVMTLPKLAKDNGYKTIYVGQSEDDRTMPYIREGYGFDERMYESSDMSGWSVGIDRFLTNVRRKQKTFLFMHTYAIHDPYMVGTASARRFIRDDLGFPKDYAEFSRTDMSLLPVAIGEITDRLRASGTGSASARLSYILTRLKQTASAPELDRIFSEDLQFEERLDIWYTRYRNKYDGKNPHHVNALVDIYDDLIFRLDRRLRSILEPVLTDPAVMGNTVIVITSDHGEAFMEHGTLGHDNSIYAEETRVPLIFLAPRLAPGEVGDMVQSIDIAPTLTSILGLPRLPLSQGRDLFASRITPGVLLAEYRGGTNIMVRDSRWSLLIRHASKPGYLLYDRATDPAERFDVAAAHPDIVASLIGRLRDVYAASPKVPVIKKPYPDWVDEQKRKRLIRNGYF